MDSLLPTIDGGLHGNSNKTSGNNERIGEIERKKLVIQLGKVLAWNNRRLTNIQLRNERNVNFDKKSLFSINKHQPLKLIRNLKQKSRKRRV